MEQFAPGIKECLTFLENGNCEMALQRANAIATASPEETHTVLLLAYARSACGDRPGAISLLQTYLASVKGSAHATLQTWHWLRDLDIEPSPEVGRKVLGLIVEIAFPDGIDTIAAYSDGSSRFFGKAGGTIFGQERRPEVQDAARRSISSAAQFVTFAKKSDGSDEPKVGTARFIFLTPGGRLESETTTDELKNGKSELLPLFTPIGELKVLKIRGHEAPQP